MKCPPGFVCIDSVIGGVLLAIGIIMCFYLIFYMMSMRLGNVGTVNRPIIIQSGLDSHTPSVRAIPIPTENKYARAPQPLRDWMAPPEFPPRGGIASIPINIPTQGLPESFHTIGVVNVDGDPWPIYGRRTGGSSDRWNYYTRNNTYNPVPLPI